MLTYNEIKAGTYIELDNEPYEVLDAHVFRKQQRKPVNQTKLRHLIQGNVIEQTFQHSDKVPEANVSSQPIVFIYNKRDEYVFHTAEDKSERFSLEGSIVGNEARFLVQGMEVDGVTYEGQIVGVQLPIKADLTVTDAPPNVKGDTAQGGTKRVTLESGAEVAVPMFVEAGDVVRVNTQTGEYDTRVSKK